MKTFPNEQPTPGLRGFEHVDKNFPDDGYMVHKDYLMIELRRNGFVLDFYLRSRGSKGSTIFVNVPELAIISELKHDKVGMLRFMSQSEGVSELVKNSYGNTSGTKNEDAVRIACIKDFTCQETATDVMCLCVNTPVPVSMRIFSDGSEEENLMATYMNMICEAAETFQAAYYDFTGNIRNHTWVRKSKLMAKQKIVEDLYTKKCFTSCFLPVDSLKEHTDVYEKLKISKCMLLTTNDIMYNYNNPVWKQDICRSMLFINASAFFPKFEGKGMLFLVELIPDGDDKWLVRIPMPVDYEVMEKLFYSKNGEFKVKDFIHNAMPLTTRLMYISGSNNGNKRLEDCIDVYLEDIKEFNIPVETYKPFRFVNGYIQTETAVSISLTRNPWSGLENVADILSCAVSVIDELLHSEKHAKNYRTKQWLHLGKDVLKIALKAHRFC